MGPSVTEARITSSIMEREYALCNLCGSDNADILYEMPDLFFHPDHVFSVVQCRNCGLAYQNPRPTPESMGFYYPKEFYENNLEGDIKFVNQRYVREYRFVQKYARKVNGRKPRLLDVGCANGGFPHFVMKKGWDVTGQDIGTPPNKREDFKVYYSLLPEIPIYTPTFDVVTSWAVMEHVHDPMAYFKKIESVLNPGGVFIFLVTNIDSLSSSTLFREDIPRHTYFFNRSTINAYMKETGLELIDAIDTNCIYSMRPIGWMTYILNKARKGPPLKWDEFPPQLHMWLGEKKLNRTPLNILRYILAYPLAAFERITLPLFEIWQKLTNTYGITIYVVRKPS